MQTVFTGWRTVTPGPCYECGCDCDWDCDGRGTIFCSCQCCADCGCFDGHETDCPVLAWIDESEASCG